MPDYYRDRAVGEKLGGTGRAGKSMIEVIGKSEDDLKMNDEAV